MPPEIVERLLPTVLVTRMPPEETVSVWPAAMPSVEPPAVLNRKLLTDCVDQAVELVA